MIFYMQISSTTDQYDKEEFVQAVEEIVKRYSGRIVTHGTYKADLGFDSKEVIAEFGHETLPLEDVWFCGSVLRDSINGVETNLLLDLSVFDLEKSRLVTFTGETHKY